MHLAATPHSIGLVEAEYEQPRVKPAVIDGRWATLAAQVSVGLNHLLSLTPFWGTDTSGFYPTTIWIRLRWEDAARRLTVEPDKRMRRWFGGARLFAVEVVGRNAKRQQIEFHGKRVTFTL